MHPAPPEVKTYDVLNAYARWTVYLHSSGQQMLWIGCCREAELLGAPDARRNSEWLHRVSKGPIAMTVLGTFDNEREAQTAALEAVAINKPICNLVGTVRGNRGRVQCIETGAVYSNASEACRMVKCSAPAMSNHLSGSPQQRTIKGFTFRRI